MPNSKGNHCTDKCTMFTHILCVYSCSRKLMASPNNIQKTWKRKGRKRRACQRTPAEEHCLNNFWTRIVQRHGFPKLARFWLHLTLKKAIWLWPKGPPRGAKFKAIIVLTNAPCSPIFYVCIPAAENWWQPKQHPKNMEKKGEKEKGMPADSCRRTIPQ